MKKLKIYIVLIFFTFFGISTVSAKEVQNVCHYKTSDEKITMAVLNYGDGSATAYLTNPFTTADGFREDQALGAHWDVGDFSKGSSCDPYLLFTLSWGWNSLKAVSSVPTLSENQYILQNYDFNSGASFCKYQGLFYDSYLMKYTNVNFSVWINGNSIFYNYDNADNSNDDNFQNAMVDYYDYGEKIGTAGSFHSEFKNSFNKINKCPALYTKKSAGGVTTFSATTSGDGTDSAFKLIESSIAPTVDEPETAKEYRVNFLRSENQPTNVNFIFRANTNKLEEICAEIDGKENQCYQLPLEQEVSFRPYITIEGKYRPYVFSITPEESEKFFVYEDIDNPATLRDPEPVYFNPKNGLDDSFYISKTKGMAAAVGNEGQVISGLKYKDLVAELCPLLKANSKFNNSLTKSYNDPNITLIDLPTCSPSSLKDQELENATEASLGKIADYCTAFYSNFSRYKNYSTVWERIDECINFETFYGNLVDAGVIKDARSECTAVSPDLLKVLKGILTIIKIAGPIIALGFGVLDFIKTVAAGDADKEMKNTFKRFMIRIGSAILLLIIPIIISFLLDVFLGNKDEYNSDNPFCHVVDWEELK